MKDRNLRTVSQAVFTVPIAGELSQKTTPQDIRRFVAIARHYCHRDHAASDDRQVGFASEKRAVPRDSQTISAGNDQ